LNESQWSRLECLGRTPFDIGLEVLFRGRIGNLQVARENVEDASQVRCALNIGTALDAAPGNLDNSLLFERLYSSTNVAGNTTFVLCTESIVYRTADLGECVRTQTVP